MSGQSLSSRSASVHRRRFLETAAASMLVPHAFAALLSQPKLAKAAESAVPLVPTADETTGLPLMLMPKGFRYLTFGWKGDPLSDGTSTPAGHDGMGVIQDVDGVVTIVRNHELNHIGRPFGTPEIRFDQRATGGCTNLTFDTRQGKWLSSWASIAGTSNNCAGGPTPWGTWLTCEETLVQDGDKNRNGQVYGLDHAHGFIFEVPAATAQAPQPLKEMGRFVHEAVAIDPNTGVVYETEDRGAAGFYRFLPKRKEHLADGGELQMMVVAGSTDLRKEHRLNHPFETRWVTIADPLRPHSPGTTDGGGVYQQGVDQGACTFARLEGAWWGDNAVYFTATSGGRAEAGQVWKYEPAQEILTLIFESPGTDVLDSPDNITVRPQGGLVLCEDPSRSPALVHALTVDGKLFPLLANNTQLNGERNSLRGDFRGSEWTGATFSPDGQWLFVNQQNPGITCAITGPWDSLGLSG
jgi:uncharacterized protein